MARSRRFGWLCVITMIPFGTVTGLAPASAYAATPCIAADLYAHRTVTPPTITAGARFGTTSVSGDFNKDGYADVAVGAPTDTVGGVAGGSVTVFKGSANGLSTPGTRLTETNAGGGIEAGDRFGAALAVGDFNKDGYADLAVGAPGEAIGTAAGSGAIAVFSGGPSGLSGGKAYDQTTGGGGDEAGDNFGTALAAADLNGDGYADLAIGVPGEIPHQETTKGGSIYVYKGSASGIVKGWDAKQENAGGATEAGDRFGAALAAGNVTGSAHADLVIGAPAEAPGADPAGSGSIYVIPGAAVGKAAGFGLTQEGNGGGNEAGDNFGATLAVGNFDKDGYTDVAVGIPGEVQGADVKSGSVVILPGAATKLGAAFWLQEGGAAEQAASNDRFGATLTTGDADHDGYADLVIGAPGKAYGPSGAGVAFLFRGHARPANSTVSLTTGRRLTQIDAGDTNEGGDNFGSSAALADVNGDGKAEAVVGAAGEGPGSQATSGTATVLSKLVPAASAPVPVESYAATAVLQASPVEGAQLGTIEYAYTDNIGRLLHGHQPDPDNFNSVQWTVVSSAEAYTGRPGLGEQGDGRLTITGHNAAGPVWSLAQATKNPPAWAAWLPDSLPMASHSTIGKLEDGRPVAFAVDTQGVLWALPQTAAGGPYTSWISLGVAGLADAAPSVATVSGGIRLFVLDANGVLRTMVYANGAVTGCTSISEPGFTTTPAVVVYPGSKVRLFSRGADGTIITKQQDDAGAFPDAWDQVPGLTAVGMPSALISPLSGKTEIVARGAEGAVYSTGETAQGSGTWREWARKTFEPDVSATDPTAFPYMSINGSSWAFAFRTDDNQTRVYYVPTSLAAAAERDAVLQDEVTFVPETLPAPPE
ncbi:FG-GAP repeat protein [Planomonospora sp. ID91781]|uniref:FG-GAP-like repeat-containing protein n=1 Tax=Planomonospora sp. ID91781 TaxID=2738135 RepID=UPI0018C363C4|nr:FG-GAP-like repeat-containing protein [Planomonospora sp. ID91781]MBG0825911.1 FG-GAP repeat protein [Planomonospora sp. ID91781]